MKVKYDMSCLDMTPSISVKHRGVRFSKIEGVCIIISNLKGDLSNLSFYKKKNVCITQALD